MHNKRRTGVQFECVQFSLIACIHLHAATTQIVTGRRIAVLTLPLRTLRSSVTALNVSLFLWIPFRETM